MTFSEFIQTLDEWESELLQYVEMDNDPFEFCVALQPYRRAVTDGLVRRRNHGAYGWTIRNEHGQRVASGMGPASGSSPTSYRAEAYGMLSILRFLIRIAEYTGMKFPWTGVIGTDSQSLLDTLNGVDDVENCDDIPMPVTRGEVILDVLIPDWDVVVEIQGALKQLPHIKLTYVKGHQDRTTPYSHLDQMAQLNVDADAKASEFQDAHGACRPLVKMMPTTGVHLVGPQGTITSHYPKQMRYYATVGPLRQYMLTRYQWSPAIFASVHWEAHGAALKKSNKKRIHYTKLVFDVLPTHHQANKYDNGKRTCPSCDHPTENRDHILRCMSPNGVTWRASFLQSWMSFIVERPENAFNDSIPSMVR
jgi:ribonuclease HI